MVASVNKIAKNVVETKTMYSWLLFLLQFDAPTLILGCPTRVLCRLTEEFKALFAAITNFGLLIEKVFFFGLIFLYRQG